MKYFGPYKIEDKKVVGTTATGQEILELTVAGKEQKVTVTKRGLEESATEEALDHTQFRDTRYQKLIARLAQECLDSGLNYDDINYVKVQMENTILNYFGLAACASMDRPYIPGCEILADMALTDAQLMLEKHVGTEDGDNGSASEGEGSS